MFRAVVAAILISAVLLPNFGRVPSAEPTAGTLEEMRAAVGKALPLLRKGAEGHVAQKTCFACHNQALPVLALTTARERGFPFPSEDLKEQLEFIATFLEGNQQNYRQGKGQGGQADTASYALLTLELGGWAPDATTEAVVEYLLLRDKDRDHWRTTSNRPPSEASNFTVSYLALRALKKWGAPGQHYRVAKRIDAVREWLLKAKARDTEDRVFRVWALREASADDEAVRAAVRELADAQREDGGWAQTDALESDAYATGSALVALHQAGGLPTGDTAYQRGVAFLLKTQREDGSWLVRSRSRPFQTYYESGFPHGKDQFISIAASGWATTALALACSPAADDKKDSAAAKPPRSSNGELLSHEVVRVSDADARNPVEVSVAINPAKPDHLIAVSLQGSRPGQRLSSNYAYVSSDGGRTWKTVAAANPGPRTQGDDMIAFGADGLAVRTYIAFEGIRVPRPARAANGIFTSTTRDGLTWTDPVPVVDHVNSVTPFEDKPHIRIDGAADSPHKGNVYLCWSRFDVYGSKDPEHKTHIYFARSKDSGKTYAVPLRISDTPGDCVDSSKTVMGAVTATGPKGEVYVAWAGPRGIVCDRSTDGGWTFGKDVVVSDNPGGWDIPVPGMARHNGLPAMGVDLSAGPDRGTVYVNWIDKRHGDPDVFVAASRDGGATWGEPIRVNDDPKGNSKDQLFTWMAVDPVDGSVNVVFYDRRDHDGTLTGLTLARSPDGGKTFVNHRVNQDAADFGPGVFFGDYLGIDARGGRVVAVYPQFTGKRQVALFAALFQFKSQAAEPGLKQKPESADKATDKKR